QDAIARGLRLGRDRGELLAEELVHQRRLAHVGPSDNGAEAGAHGGAYSTNSRRARADVSVGGMGLLALACAVAGSAAVALAGAGRYLAMGLGLYAVATGFAAYRRTGRAGARLLGAAGVAVGLVALVLGGAKVGLTLIAVDHVAHLWR